MQSIRRCFPVLPIFLLWHRVFIASQGLIMEQAQHLYVFVKSGQSFKLLQDKPFVAQPEWTLRSFKERIYKELGSPEPEYMVLVLQIEQTQQKLEGEEKSLSSLGLTSGCTVFLYSDKVWNAQETLNDASASAESRRQALQGLPFEGRYAQFLEDLRKAQELSLVGNKEVEAAQKQLRERAALFGLAQAPDIDAQGDCQFDAVADQLKRIENSSGETKESVRATVVSWIQEHEDEFDLKNWVEAMPEYASLEQYLEKMSQSRYWGDEVTLLAIVEAYGVQLVMLSSLEEHWYRTYYPRGKGPADQLPCIWLAHEHERHYWSLAERDLKLEASRQQAIQERLAALEDDVTVCSPKLPSNDITDLDPAKGLGALLSHLANIKSPSFPLEKKKPESQFAMIQAPRLREYLCDTSAQDESDFNEDIGDCCPSCIADDLAHIQFIVHGSSSIDTLASLLRKKSSCIQIPWDAARGFPFSSDSVVQACEFAPSVLSSIGISVPEEFCHHFAEFLCQLKKRWPVEAYTHAACCGGNVAMRARQYLSVIGTKVDAEAELVSLCKGEWRSFISAATEVLCSRLSDKSGEVGITTAKILGSLPESRSHFQHFGGKNACVVIARYIASLIFMNEKLPCAVVSLISVTVAALLVAPSWELAPARLRIEVENVTTMQAWCKVAFAADQMIQLCLINGKTLILDSRCEMCAISLSSRKLTEIQCMSIVDRPDHHQCEFDCDKISYPPGHKDNSFVFYLAAIGLWLTDDLPKVPSAALVPSISERDNNCIKNSELLISEVVFGSTLLVLDLRATASLSRMPDYDTAVRNKWLRVMSFRMRPMAYVAHRWAAATHPDISGCGWRAIVEHITPSFEFAFIDYCCLPQSNRSMLENDHFKGMLSHLQVYQSKMETIFLHSYDSHPLSRGWLLCELLYSNHPTFVPVMQDRLSKFLGTAALTSLRDKVSALQQLPYVEWLIANLVWLPVQCTDGEDIILIQNAILHGLRECGGPTK